MIKRSVGLELLATAHWVADNENAHTDQAITDAFYAWNPGKACQGGQKSAQNLGSIPSSFKFHEV